jgi:hypothetical protein
VALVDFLTALHTRIDSLADRVFYGDIIAPGTKIPYVTWKYTTTSDIETLEDFFVEVDITDNGPDATRIEGIVAAIDGDGSLTSASGLNYWKSGSGARPTFRMFRINRLALPALDEMILRRQLRYRVRTYL